EHTLTGHPAIRQCAVILRDDTYLAAYIVGDTDPGELRQHLAKQLPTYMVPTVFVTLPELPLTPNGKLDTAALPDPAPRTGEHLPPRTDTERWLATTWQELLGVEQVGADDNFFTLGGNSL
ncbi:AMP-binding enzyme, partial [Streptosporangium sp. DT93]|uniref:AMP-binding enzyme n=1 Tax=Streptosporangium sp. DT93 TaxID=3393428 RepID=UPI003CFB7D82